MSKKEWRTPEVRQLKAGAAEFGNKKVKDDGDVNKAKDNS